MTTPVTSEKADQTVCPECSALLTDDPRFTRWCPSCHWNALPQGKPRTTESGGLRDRLDQAMEQRLFQEASSGRGLRPRRGGAHVAVTLLALPVHLVTLAAAVGVVLLLRIGVWTADLGAIALAGVAYLGRPRLGRVARVTKGRHVLARESAPQLWALADSVAAGLGTRGPDIIVVDGRFNASYQRVGWRRRVVLTLGLPLWLSLSEQERVALLAHEFGHGANGDSRRGIWLGAALGSLAEWVQLLKPPPNRLRSHGLEALAALLAMLAQSFLRGVAELYLRALLRLTRHDGRRAEYLADSFMVGLAGAPGAEGLLEVLHLHTAFETIVAQRRLAGRRLPTQRFTRAALQKERQNPTASEQTAAPDLWTSLSAYVHSIPAEERTRRVVAAQLTHDDFDATHPPRHLRLAFVRGLPAGEPAVVLDPRTSTAIDDELRPVGVAVEAELLDR
jgi:Zn-dependent protease with chaperone function